MRLGSAPYAASRMSRWRKRNPSSSNVVRPLGADQVAARQLRKVAREARPLVDRHQVGHRARPERSSDDRGTLEHAALDLRQAVEASGQERPDRRWDREVHVGSLIEHSRDSPCLLRSERDELLEEEGVALGRGHDAGPQRPGRKLRREVVEQGRCIRWIQRIEADQDEAGTSEDVRTHLLELGACDGDQEDRTLTRVLDVVEGLQERGLGPLQIVDEQDQRAIQCERLDEAPHGPGDLFPGYRLVGEADDRGDPAANEVAAVQPRDDGVQLRERLGSCLPGRDPRSGNDEFPDRPVGDAVAVGQATRPQDAGSPGHPREGFGDEAAFPDARRADHCGHTRRPTGGDTLEGRHEQVQLTFSTDERSDRRTRDRFAFDQPEQANHGRLRGTGRLVRQWLSRHHRTNQPFGLRDHDDVAWRGLGGEARRYVDRRTRYGRAVRAMRDRQDLPCRQTDAEEERIGIPCRSGRRRELRRRSDCSQRIILASDQEPEHGGHAVGIRQIDGAAMPLDRATDDVHGPTSDRLEDLRVERVLVARVNTLRTQHGNDPAVPPLARPSRDRHVPWSRPHPGSESPPPELAGPGLDQDQARSPGTAERPGRPGALRPAARRHRARA